MNEPGPLHPVAASLEPLRGGLASYPPPERWDDWKEYDPARWPKRVEKHYTLIPTICFNCEAGCGLLAYVDREKLDIHKFEGNPVHPGSRGRNCAKSGERSGTNPLSAQACGQTGRREVGTGKLGHGFE